MNEKKYRIEVTLNDHQQEFIEWMAERDHQSFREELRTIFYLQLREDLELYYEEMITEGDET